MKNYVLCTALKDIETAPEEFLELFHVDIRDGKYEEQSNLVEKWNAIVTDIWGTCYSYDNEKLIAEFAGKLYQVIYGEVAGIVRPRNIKEERKKKAIKELEDFINELKYLEGTYNIYEPDVWLNAYLSMRFIKSTDKRFQNSNGDDNAAQGCLLMDESYCIKAKGITYQIPFEDYNERFCTEYIKLLMGKDEVQTLGVGLTENEEFEYVDVYEKKLRKGYKKYAEFKLKQDMRYERWSRKHILKLENYKDFKVEDRYFFHKSINGILARNISDAMILTERLYDVENYLYLVNKICAFKSLNWQKFVSSIYFLTEQFQEVLEAFEIWGKVQALVEVWFRRIEQVNSYLMVLTKGLLYIAYKDNENFSSMESECNMEKVYSRYLEEVEKSPFAQFERENELIKSEWEKDVKKLRVTAAICKNHRDYHWTYAILQRHIIDCSTPKKIKQFERENRD